MSISFQINTGGISLTDFDPLSPTQLEEESPRTLSRKKICRYALAFFAARTSYSLINYGTAKTLGLYTFVHGTGPLGYMGIRLNGGQTSFGGASIGASNGIMNFPSIPYGAEDFIFRSKSFFHMFADPALEIERNPSRALSKKIVSIPIMAAMFALQPRYFAVIGTAGTFTSPSLNKSPTEKISAIAAGCLIGPLVPKTYFHFSSYELSHFEKDKTLTLDPDFMNTDVITAVRISRDVSRSRIGLTGALFHGLDRYTFQRMSERPLSVGCGLVIIAAGIALGIADYRYCFPKETSIESSAIFPRKKGELKRRDPFLLEKNR